MYLSTGSKNDDGSGNNIRRLLVAVSSLLYYDLIFSGSYKFSLYTRSISSHVLVSYEQLHVQSYHILLDECQVKKFQIFIYDIYFHFCFINFRFRRGFKQFFSCLPFIDDTPGALTRREVLTSRRRSYSGSPDHNRIIRNGNYCVNSWQLS